MSEWCMKILLTSNTASVESVFHIRTDDSGTVTDTPNSFRHLLGKNIYDVVEKYREAGQLISAEGSKRGDERSIHDNGEIPRW